MLRLLFYSKIFVMSLCIIIVIILSYGYYITFIILRWCIDVRVGVLNVVFAYLRVHLCIDNKLFCDEYSFISNISQ